MRPTTPFLLPTATGVALLALLVGCPAKGGKKAAEASSSSGPVAAPAPLPASLPTPVVAATAAQPPAARKAAAGAAAASPTKPAAKPVPVAKPAAVAKATAAAATKRAGAPAAKPASAPAAAGPSAAPATVSAAAAVAKPAAALAAEPAPMPAPGTAAAPAAIAVPAPAPSAVAAAAAPTAAPALPTKASLKAAAKAAAKAEAKAKASYQRVVASYGAQMALVSPSNGGLRLAASGPGVALGLHTVWTLPKGLRLRPRLDYTVFTGETRSSTAAPLPQTLDTRVSSLALGVDLLYPIGGGWSVGLALAETRWSVASTNTVTSTLGGSLTVSGTSHWGRLAYGPVLTYRFNERLELEARALSSHYGYQNQPAATVAVGLLWRF